MYVLASLVAVMFVVVSVSLTTIDGDGEGSAETAEIGHRLGEVAGWLIAMVAVLGAGL